MLSQLLFSFITFWILFVSYKMRISCKNDGNNCNDMGNGENNDNDNNDNANVNNDVQNNTTITTTATIIRIIIKQQQ